MTENKRNYVLIGVIVGVIIGAILAIVVYLKNKPIENTNLVKEINVGYSPLIVNLPIMIAQQKEFFQQSETLKDLKINLIPVASTQQLRDGVTTGKFDFAFSLGTEMFLQNNILEKGNVYALSFNVMSKERFLDAIIVKDSSKLKEISEISGLKIGCYPSPTIRKFLELYSKEKGIKFEIIDVNPTQEFSLLENGNIDAFFALEPFLTVAKNKGYRVLENAPVETTVIKDEFPVGTSCVNGNFYKKNNKLVLDFQKAIKQSIDFIEGNKAEAIKIGEQFLKSPENTFANVSLPKWVLGCDYKNEKFDKVESFFVSNGLINELVKPQDYIICNEK